MPRTHTARLLTTGALFGPVFAGATLYARLLTDLLTAPWLGPLFAAALLVATTLLALAAFRPLHLVFTGAEPREPLAAAVADPPWWQSIPLIVVALVLLGLGLAHLPMGVMALALPDRSYTSPISVLVAPERLELWPLRELVLAELVSPALSNAMAVVVVVIAAALGWLGSTVLYRGGAGRAHRLLLGGPRAQRVLDVLAHLAGRESQVARGVGEGAARLSRLVAANFAPGLLEALLRRIPAFVGTLVGAAVGLLANGSAQRGLTVAVIGLLALAAAWSGVFGDLGGER